jgi:hypothetical protein
LAYNNSYAQPHVPLGILFTNWGCGPCVPANQELDDIMPGFGNDAALIRLHVWWPSSNDPMYLANVSQCQSLTSIYGVNAVPDFFMDGNLQPSIAQYESSYLQRMQMFSPNTIEIAWNPDTDDLIIEVDNLAPIAPGDYRLRSVITEDDLHLQGPNGEPIHNQAFRYMYPDIAGLSVPAALGTYPYTVSCPLNGGWVYENLRATVYIQNEATYEIIQSATAFLSEIEVIPLPVGEQVVSPFELAGNYPNPFNPNTTIKFSLPSEQVVELNIYAVDGSLVTTLVNEQRSAGEHAVVWNGRDHTGAAVASGTYFYQLKADSFSDTKRMVLVK